MYNLFSSQNVFSSLFNWMDDAAKLSEETRDYCIDAWQRMIMFTDVIRQQGNNFIEENDKGLPPIIDFDYEIIFDGRDLDKPANYALARITPEDGSVIEEDARPIIIIDPRAGHGPGIGGFKKDSEVGIAMKNKHPVYFMIFSQFPEPNQTLECVTEAEIAFIEVVGRLHPKADKPAVIGNCQAGWAAALLAAKRPDITGPLFLNGSPLSYWAGKDVKNPMRYKGGLLGGVWASSLCADLGNGLFDGANLVKGFEDLNPANTYWKKKYNLYSNIDGEAERFLKFEKWWNGIFFLSSEEIKFITQELFIGNKLEKGELSFTDGDNINLKNLKEPIIVFASDGDNIAPPQQALKWVIKVWGSTEEIKRSNQVIIYLLHKDIGHLGIFVSGKVVKREHNEMIGNVDLIQYLTPGLYQMVIDDDDLNENGEPNVRFEAREIEDLVEMDEDKEEDPFWYASKVSDVFEVFYQSYLGPVARGFSNEYSAEMLRQLHPIRYERYMFSDMNPAMLPIKMLAPIVKEKRVQVPEDGLFKTLEKAVSESITSSLDYVGAMTDSAQYNMFYMLYTNPMFPLFFGKPEEHTIKDISPPPEEKYKKWKQKAKEGGIVEGVVRALIAVGLAQSMNDKAQLNFIKKMIDSTPIIVRVKKEEVQSIINDQARILKADFDYAISCIPDLIERPEDRLVALEILSCSIGEHNKAGDKEKALLNYLGELLDDRKIL